jgi:hypothetical protein
MLEACSADSRWQVSLVHAIESASPLPAPPDPSLFATHVTLDFDSATYSPGTNPDGFEPEPPKGRMAANDSSPTQFERAPQPASSETTAEPSGALTR